MTGNKPMERKYAGMTKKNIIFVLVMFTTLAVTAIFENWIKANLPWFYPFRWVLFGIVLAVGNLLNVLPGQVAWDDTSRQSVGRRAVTFVGYVVLVVLLFDGFDWVAVNYPEYNKTLRFTVLILLYIAWRARALFLRNRGAM
jgi:hypothetical protein